MNNSHLVNLVYHSESVDPLPIVPEDVDLALLALHHYPVKTASDALVVMCAANLLNSAVKQKGLPVPGGYAFKGRVSDYVEAWCAHPIDGISIQSYKDVCYVEIDSIQFSFHHLAAQDKITCRAEREPWKGIRLQPLAKRLWDAVLDTVRIPETLTRQRFEVLSHPLVLKIMKALPQTMTPQGLSATLRVDPQAIDDALQALLEAQLILRSPHDERLFINRWTLELLERELSALTSGKEAHASTH
jgi:hypothetical protein